LNDAFFSTFLVSCWALNAWGDTESKALPAGAASNLVGLEDGEHDVEEPEEGQEEEGDDSSGLAATELTTIDASSDEEADDAADSADDEDDNTEAETASWHIVLSIVDL